jgi:hypothetical protein
VPQGLPRPELHVNARVNRRVICRLIVSESPL